MTDLHFWTQAPFPISGWHLPLGNPAAPFDGSGSVTRCFSHEPHIGGCVSPMYSKLHKQRENEMHIQDFSDGSFGQKPIISQDFSKNYMKMEEIGQRGGTCP